MSYKHKSYELKGFSTQQTRKNGKRMKEKYLNWKSLIFFHYKTFNLDVFIAFLFLLTFISVFLFQCTSNLISAPTRNKKSLPQPQYFLYFSIFHSFFTFQQFYFIFVIFHSKIEQKFFFLCCGFSASAKLL